MRAAGLSLLRLAWPVFVFSCLVFGLTLVLSQWGQPWTSVSLKKLALNLLRDQLTLALDKGVFNEPLPHMVIYVSDSRHTQGGNIFISDERNPADARIIVAGQELVTEGDVVNAVEADAATIKKLISGAATGTQ